MVVGLARVAGALAPVVVVQTDDVVLARIVPTLYLDHHKLVVVEIGESVLRADADIEGSAARDLEGLSVEGARGRALDDRPVLGAVLVGLVGKSLPRAHLDPLDLVSGALVEHVPGAPRALLGLHAASVSRGLPGVTPPPETAPARPRRAAAREGRRAFAYPTCPSPSFAVASVVAFAAPVAVFLADVPVALALLVAGLFRAVFLTVEAESFAAVVAWVRVVLALA